MFSTQHADKRGADVGLHELEEVAGTGYFNIRLGEFCVDIFKIGRLVQEACANQHAKLSFFGHKISAWRY
jgi:hypothetical protein